MQLALNIVPARRRINPPLAARPKIDSQDRLRRRVYDASGTLVHIDDKGTGTRTDYVKGAGMTLARIKNGVPNYLHPDHLGSAYSATDASGTVLWREYYTPFGETKNNPASNDNQAGFTATAVAFYAYNQSTGLIIWLHQPSPKHIKDAATGLNYMQARYYDPVMGRFLSVDPVGIMSSGQNPTYFNRYAYVGNDPVNMIDPFGMYGSCASFSDAGNSQGCTEIPDVTGVEFDTEAQAVEAIGGALNEMSSTENGTVSGYAPEYGAAISETENGFTPTVAVTDDGPGSVNLGGLLEGTENPIADIHSHGNDNTGSSNTFSSGDLGAATINKQQFGTERSYVVTPSGAIHSFTPNSSMRAPVTRGQFGMNRVFVKPSNSALPDYRGANR